MLEHTLPSKTIVWFQLCDGEVPHTGVMVRWPQTFGHVSLASRARATLECPEVRFLPLVLHWLTDECDDNAPKKSRLCEYARPI